MATTQQRKAIVTVLEFAVAPLTEDSDEKLTYDTVHAFNNAFTSVTNSPTVNSASLAASGGIVDSYSAKAGGNLTIGITALTQEDKQILFGETEGGVLNISSKNDLIPYVMAIYSVRASDGGVILYKIPKIKFRQTGSQIVTADESGIRYQTETLEGQYIDVTYRPVACFSKWVDGTKEEGQTAITEWFATAMGGIETSP